MIKLEVIGVNWEPGKRAGEFENRKEVLEFEDWMAEEFIRLVKVSVDEQRQRDKWAPLSAPYLAYKRKHGLSLKTWEATGELMENLIYKKSSRVVGFDNRKVHSGSRSKYLVIARSIEYGQLGVHPRPLFRPIYWYMSKNISYFLKKYEREVLV